MSLLIKHIWPKEKGPIVLILFASVALRLFIMGSRDLDLNEAFTFFLVIDHSLSVSTH